MGFFGIPVRSTFLLATLLLICGCPGGQPRNNNPGGGGGGGGANPQAGNNRNRRAQNPNELNTDLSSTQFQNPGQNPFDSFADGLSGGNSDVGSFPKGFPGADGFNPNDAAPSNHEIPDSSGRQIAGLNPDAKGLNRSGEGGNPSFSYAVRGYKQGNAVPTPQCQGTLVSKEAVARNSSTTGSEGKTLTAENSESEEVCTVLTAAHCLIDAEDVNNPTPPASRFPGVTEPDRKTRKVVALTAPDFGSIEALAVLNSTYVSQNKILSVEHKNGGLQINTSPSSHDIALLMFKGDACKNTKAQVVPMSTSCAGELRVASRWKRRSFSANPIGALIDTVKVAIKGTGIKQGDSGGGMFCYVDGKAVATMGALSTGGGSDSKNGEGFWNEASYSAKDSLRWAISTAQGLRDGSSQVALPRNKVKPSDRALAAR